MAIQTTTIAEFNNGLGTVQYTWDDVSHKVQQVLLTDLGLPDTITMSAIDNNGNILRTWTGTVKNGTTTVNVPQNGANSVTLVQTPRGFWVLPFSVTCSG